MGIVVHEHLECHRFATTGISQSKAAIHRNMVVLSCTDHRSRGRAPSTQPVTRHGLNSSDKANGFVQSPAEHQYALRSPAGSKPQGWPQGLGLDLVGVGDDGQRRIKGLFCLEGHQLMISPVPWARGKSAHPVGNILRPRGLCSLDADAVVP
uniref:Uncharacterized protein n=1 Tax=Sphaerodactylus townsendi TaxID=933632 RepID=A0ACB8ETF2_9SAUR